MQKNSLHQITVQLETDPCPVKPQIFGLEFVAVVLEYDPDIVQEGTEFGDETLKSGGWCNAGIVERADTPEKAFSQALKRFKEEIEKAS